MKPLTVRALLVAALTFANGANAAAQTGETVTYYHLDAIGSVRVVTDASAAVVARYDLQPFGLQYGSPAPQDARLFTGQERDAESGLDYFGARYYASASGRFTTVDPVLNLDAALTDPQRWNRYAYALNNPLTFVDPDGRDPVTVGVIVVAAAAILLAPDIANAPGPRDPLYASGNEAGLMASVASLFGGELAGAKLGAAAGQLWGAITGRAITSGLATGADEAVFWSGIRGADSAATRWVGQNGGATLERTLAARGIKLPAFDPDNPAVVAAWREASRAFAAGARGNVRVLQSKIVGRKSIWAEVEFPTLKANPNVRSIIAIDPDTGVETVLWAR